MKQIKLKSSHLGLIIVIGTLTTLLFVLITTVIIFFWTSRLNAAEPVSRSLLTSRNPLDVDRVDPALALLSLGGVSNADIISQAIEKDRAETALAALSFERQPGDRESAGAFLLLAPIYAANQEKDKAVFAHQMAGTIATLSPDISVSTRADLFIQIAEGLAVIDEHDRAVFYLDQAFILAARSPSLQVVRRRAIFERLQKNYVALGQREMARTSLEFSANPPKIAFVSDEGPILPKSDPVLLPPQVQEAEATRWIKAQELAALLIERGGNAPEAAKTALKEALIAEDLLKVPFYEAELESEAQISRKLDITIAKIEWLSIKYRIARRAYGLNLVPEWAERAEQIRAELTKSYETLFTLYADFIIALPEASQIDRATQERLRREVLAGELGRYPNYPEEQRRRQLLEATDRLISTQPDLNVYIGSRQLFDQNLYTYIAGDGRE